MKINDFDKFHFCVALNGRLLLQMITAGLNRRFNSFVVWKLIKKHGIITCNIYLCVR